MSKRFNIINHQRNVAKTTEVKHDRPACDASMRGRGENQLHRKSEASLASVRGRFKETKQIM